MAKKQEQQKSNKAMSQAQGFTGGMVSDPDPRYQPKGSYRRALNVRLTNDAGNTFTVENIEGNRKMFNLNDICQQTYDPGLTEGILGTRVFTKAGVASAGEKFSEIYMHPSTTDGNGNEVGDFFPSPNNGQIGPTFSGVIPFIGTSATATFSVAQSFQVSIVGHYSYNNNVIFVIVKPHVDFPTDPDKSQTIFLDVRFDRNLRIEMVYDLMVCYDHVGANNRYPDLKMKVDTPIRMEGIIENECISRIFWTDNINPLRSLNLGKSGLNRLSPDVLDLTPLHSPSQPVLTKTINGSLPVGQLQYCYKYISSNGGETVMSPFSNLYHTSKHSFSTYSNYYGSISGDPLQDVSSQGFEIKIKDLDNDFDVIELYSILHVQNDGPIRVSLVGSQQFASSASEVTFYHTNWNGDLAEGIDSILIDINTWNICKDIVIKDNILLAGNLQTLDNSISEKEWNVKVRRYNIIDSSGSSNTGTITSNDSQILEYEIPSGSTEATSVPPSLGLTWTNGMPKWRTYKGDDTSTIGGTDYNDKGRVDILKKQSHEYRYLSDGLTLGGESYDYSNNDLGGCRLTFDLKQRQVDFQNNVSVSPFIQAGPITDLQTDNISRDDTGSLNTDNTDTDFVASMSLGGSKDPSTGNFKGYRRGEMYRFGVQIYDKNGRAGNVLWIGDIEMPEMNDPLRRLRSDDSDYNPGMPTYGTDSLFDKELFGQLDVIGDHRTSYIYGCTTPGIDVSWFNQTAGYFSSRPTYRYIKNGELSYNYAAQENTITASTTNNTGAGLDLHAAYARSNGKWDWGSSNAVGWISPNVLVGSSSILDSDYTVKQIPNRYKMQNSFSDDVHYALDLFVNFEFRIPSDVRDKISGFRVVRAERQESDKSILQQGILNQTVAYGHNKVEKGYSEKRIGWEKSGDQFINTTAIDQTIHEVYDSILNGYIGLAENSNLAFRGKVNNNYTLLQSAAVNTEQIFAWNEFEEAMSKHNSAFEYWNNPMDYQGTTGQRTPFTPDPKRRHSAYFGCYEVMPNVKELVEPTNRHDLSPGTHTHYSKGACAQAVQGSIFTLDSPDSAFGTSPYSHRTGDKIRVDAIMKLVYDLKTLGDSASTVPGLERPFGFSNHSGESYSANDATTSEPGAVTNDGTSTSLHRIKNNLNATTGKSWHPQNDELSQDNTLRYCKKISIGSDDEGYGALIAKYYIYDTYYGIGLSVDGGAGYGNGFKTKQTGEKHDDPATPFSMQYRASQFHDVYHHEILNAKELEEGEVVSKSFFKNGVLMIDEGDKAFATPATQAHADNNMSGFSNNTLGFYSGVRRAEITSGSHKQEASGGTSFLFSMFGIVNATSSSSGPGDLDRTYDTMSTVQKGLKSILIQIDGDGERGEKRGLLNPRDLSAILENRNWNTGQGVDRANFHGWMSEISNEHNKRNYDTGNVGIKTSVNCKFGGPSYIPYKFLCSIVRNIIPYGGPGQNAIVSTRYIPAGNFHPIKKDANGDSDANHLSKVFGGDTFVNFYSHQKTACDTENNSYARWQVFPVESDTNTDMRLGYHLAAGDTNIGDTSVTTDTGELLINTNDWEANDVYSQENNLKSAISVDETRTCKSLDLPYQIVYSETKISGEAEDSFKVFKQFSFHDMETQYGEVTRLAKWKNDVYVLQESSMSKLLVNPISMIADELGSSLFTGTGETVENHLYISTKFGTRNMESVVSTEKAIYYIDNTYGKLIQYTGESLKVLSDDLGQRNALESIIKGEGSLDSKKKVGRNFICDNALKFNGITSIFDYKNNELIITMHSSTLDTENNREVKTIGAGENAYQVATTNSQTIVYSESLNAFTSYYSVTPRRWMSIGGYVTSTESDIYLDEKGPFTGAPGQPYIFNDNHLSVWKWDEQIHEYKTMFFDENITPSASDIALSGITKSISEIPSDVKVFDNAKIVMTPNSKSNLTNQFVIFETETTGPSTLDINNNTVAKYQEGILRFPLRDTTQSGPRMRGTYINIEYSTRSTNKFNIFAILAKYRKSYN